MNLLVLKYRVLKTIKCIRVRKLKKYNDSKRRKYIQKMYFKRTGKRLDWSNLHTYTEKMQWIKLYGATDLKSKLADKYAVREWVKEKIGSEYLIPLLGVWDDPKLIDFNNLPEKFVLKVTNGSSTNIIVDDKSKIDIDVTKAKLDYWMKVDRSYQKGFELHYANIVPRIIAEEFIEYKESTDLPDYKFLCFNGEPYYCWVDVGRYHNHKRNIYDLEWNLQPFNQSTYGNVESPIDKPKNFEKMIDIARVLCKGFSHVRVDLYDVNGKIYFGEMTFTNGSGYELIVPEEYNKCLGDLWKIDGIDG